MASQASDIDVEAETDRLYQLPLEAFVEARNALAARLKSIGDKEGAARVKALVRPSVPAWAANQVYWRARAEFDALVASVERLRNAQLPGAVGGAALREAMKARRDAQGLVLRSAVSLLTDAGHGTTPGALLRVSNTLEALAAEGARSSGVLPGRLVQDREPPGFDSFAAIAGADLSTPSPRPRAAPTAQAQHKAVAPERPVEAKPTEREDAAERLRAALAESEKRLDGALREAREADGALSVAEKRAEAARGELEEARRRFERAHERAAVTAEEEGVAQRNAQRLAAFRDAAEAERDAALLALRAVEQDR